MMSAILKIKPQLDQAEAKKMERSLFDRFKNIGKTAKKTLKDVVSGGFLGFAVGLAQSMLSPIEEVENRIKGMLDKAIDLREMAEEFNTSAGKLQAIQNNAALNGLKPEQLKSLMSAFRQTVDEAQERIFKKEPLDEKTSLVKNFIGEKDTAEAFFGFIQALRRESEQSRESAEKLLFGNVQYGGAKKFIDNAGVVGSIGGNPDIARVDKEVEKLGKLGDDYRIKKMLQDQKEMSQYAETLNQSYIASIDKYEQTQKAKELRQLKSYDDLAAARLAVDKISGVMENLTLLLSKLVGYAGQIIEWIQKSPAGKGFFKVIGIR